MKNKLTKIQVIKKSKYDKRYFRSIKYPPIPLSRRDKYVRTTDGDRLDSLARIFYKDHRLWWVIANANRDIIRRDSFYLKPGLQIRIPGNINSILSTFENSNLKNY